MFSFYSTAHIVIFWRFIYAIIIDLNRKLNLIFIHYLSLWQGRERSERSSGEIFWKRLIGLRSPEGVFEGSREEVESEGSLMASTIKLESSLITFWGTCWNTLQFSLTIRKGRLLLRWMLCTRSSKVEEPCMDMELD